MSGFERDRYWQEFRELLAANDFGLPKIGAFPREGLYQHFKEPVSGFELCARIDEQKSEIAVELINRRPKDRESLITKTETIRSQVKVGYAVQLKWDDHKNLKQLKGEEVLPVRGLEEEDWLWQHLWMVARLVAIKTAYFPDLQMIGRVND